MIFNTNSHKLQNFAQYGPEGGHMWYKKKPIVCLQDWIKISNKT